ncbi:MAG TPA: flagellar FliJ family protein [Chloroflexota bacterium]|jgi:flagellar biosynthesis chaperone FliJ|nr:flagellar FliJ family protein [Chloroflexota bacterium]
MSSAPFRLQTVLDYRAHLVDRLRLELAALQHRQQEEAARLAALEAAERAALAQLRAQQAPSPYPVPPSPTGEGGAGEGGPPGASGGTLLDLPRLMQLTEHLNVLAARIAAQRELLAQLAAEEAALLERIVAHQKDVKALEKLRERHLAECALSEARRERVESSELALRQYQRLRAAL